MRGQQMKSFWLLIFLDAEFNEFNENRLCETVLEINIFLTLSMISA